MSAEETAKIIKDSDEVEEYIRSLEFGDTSDEVKTLIVGNIRAFAAWYRQRLKEHL